MSLRLLLDEQISAKVADQVRASDPSVSIQSLHRWRGGSFLGKDDDLLLVAAAEESLTLVTYDQKTIPTLLVQMALLGQSHGGVLFVDDRTIASNNLGALVKGLLSLWRQCHGWDWTNRVMLLQPGR